MNGFWGNGKKTDDDDYNEVDNKPDKRYARKVESLGAPKSGFGMFGEAARAKARHKKALEEAAGD
jgi:hypothetical protein